MKTPHTDEQIQTAINAACEEINKQHNKILTGCFAIDEIVFPKAWAKEKPCRLGLAKAFLEKLEADPFADLKKAHAEGRVIQALICGTWGQVSAPTWDYPRNTYRIKPEPETFEAHGKTWTKHITGTTPDIDGNALVIVLTVNDFMPDPLRAANWNWEGGSIIGWRYADALQTNPDQTQVAWTPAVGDVVRLKSGGPMMTIRQYDKEDPADVWCHWFNDAKSCGEAFPTACLVKEDAQ